MTNPFANTKFRAACYALVGAVLAVAGVYGVLNSDQIASWLNVAGALFLVLALVNTKDAGGDQ